MRPVLVLLGLALAAQPLAAQAIDHTRVRRYAGEEITVRGPVARAANAGGGNVWLSLGRPHPNSTLVVIIPAGQAGNFGDVRTFEGTTIEVLGRILTPDMSTGATSDPTTAGAIRGGAPRTPYIVLTAASRLRVVDTTAPPPASSAPPAARR